MSDKRYDQAEVLELLRAIARDDLEVDCSNAVSIRELLSDVYAAGGSDAVNGLIALQGSGVPVHMVVPYAAAEAASARRPGATGARLSEERFGRGSRLD